MSFSAIQKEIESIPSNGPVLEELCKLLETREAIALVGAGASAGLWPLWDQFLQGFIEYGQKHDKITQDDAEFLLEEAAQTPLETAQQLRNMIGDNLYFDYLHETFSDKHSDETNGSFTRTHQALLQLPICNYLTLNYDAGLTNARAALHPRATTSYYFWDQEEATKIREKDFHRYVLHAHGRYDRADSIILTQDDYHKAYSHRPFVRLLDEVFAFEQLIFVGFGLSDPYIKQLFNSISGDYKKSALRHIALVGLDEQDSRVTKLKRERVEMVLGARVLFYPTKNHHKALTDWLTALAEKYGEAPESQSAQEVQPLTVSPGVKQALPDRYVHQPSDDENFKGRAQDFATLNRWGNDPATRTIAVVGMGGQGKTGLVGRWLKQERTPELADMPVFYWSFYEDLDVGKFLREVVEFCLPLIRIPGPQGIEPISFLLRVVQELRLLLVLDGLEVLQEDTNSQAHGQIRDPNLQQFLQQWLRYPHQGLMVLTSRFPFPQLARYSGIGFHHLDLLRLSQEDGVSLLEQLQLRGSPELLGEYVEKFHGHPLALRVLASAVKRACFGDLAQFEGDQIVGADPEDRLGQKLERLLGFYESRLHDGQRELLGIISLFKRPVEQKSFVTLLRKMESLENTPLAQADETGFQEQLNILTDDFLVEMTREGITTHPVIRDYFRTRHALAGSRREVADFLTQKPGAEQPQNIEEVRDLVEAVQLLCDEEEFKAAHDLRRSRLDSGGYDFNVFRHLPAPTEGLECELAFVGDEIRQKKIAEELGKTYVAAHMSGVALYNLLLGNLAQAREWRYKSLDIRRQLQNKHQQAFDLHEISAIEIAMGDIGQSLETISPALSLSHETRNLEDLSADFASKAYYEFLLGNTSQAYQDYEVALFYAQKREADEQFLSSIWGNQQSEFFIRLEDWKQFEAVNAWNIKICEEYHVNRDLAVCHLLRGWCEVSWKRFPQAEEELDQAERTLRPSGLVQDICRLDWAWALLAEAKGDYHSGLQRVLESLFTCADKGFRLWQAASLTLRGRLYLLQFQKEDKQDTNLVEKAGDDGNAALKIAEDTGYIWAKIEALELLASYHRERATLPNCNTQEEKDFSQRYTKEVESLKKDLFLTEEQMAALKEQAREEFEKQTAGWNEDE